MTNVISQLLRNRATWVLALLTLCVAIPGWIAGAGFYREDWLAVGFARNCEGVDCFIPNLNDRPVEELLYQFTFYFFHDHPAVFYWILNSLLAITAAMAYRFARPVIGHRYAFYAVALWAIVPTHLALQHWASVIHLNTSLMLFAFALVRLREHADWKALALFVASAFTYESTVPLAAVALLIVPSLPNSAQASRGWRVSSVAALAAASFIIILLHDGGRATVWVNPLLAFAETFALGLPKSVAAIPIVIATTGIVLSLYRIVKPSSRSTTGNEERMVAAGLVIATLGVLPFMTTGYDINFRGVGDRASMISGFGAALVWIGLIGQLGRLRKSMPIAAIATAALCLGTAPVHIARDLDWSYVYREASKPSSENLQNEDALTRDPDPRARRVGLVLNQERHLRDIAKKPYLVYEPL